LVQGDSGNQITAVQQALLAAGIDLHGGVDGTFGTATAQAVATFQRQKDMDVTGVVDQRTAIALGIRPDPRNPVPSTTVPAAEQAVPGTPPPSTDGGRPSSASDTEWTVPALVVIAFNAALALYVRSRLGARRRNRLKSDAAADDDSAGGETGRDEQAAFAE
jgi:peptidoglycan hydrolase-like protein with peptidoglycan-binding domain